ncbi:glucosamine-6-phosphate deaminase [Persicitalea jodogahamensis]|uniref:Glucosamine-6-phosphate deaminase n=1 Tax=Persicitalea jodogahamensis TaxID=402147 RepID=A0A8J3G9P4_9BACT|nr:glucosamine-6-phosphate deaminase [Persicitalea jodogahamensis]GHB74807.1 glucosamine-6-phosphate deaminase [Persicitalea jodogahamensis]
MTFKMYSARSFEVENLQVEVLENRPEMGALAALSVTQKIRELLLTQEKVNIIFASAPSQNEFLAAMAANVNLEWNKVRAFHMDEYIGLPSDAPQSFGEYLREKLFSKVPINEVFYLDGNAPDPGAECRRYAELLAKYPTDIVCMGIGENCHIAFNDPHAADFDDPDLVKEVKLDLRSREQQVHDGCFPSLDQVPVSALTLTIPALTRARHLFCVVPGSTKTVAVSHTLSEPVSKEFPATIMRRHPSATLFLDPESAGKFSTRSQLFQSLN